MHPDPEPQPAAESPEHSGAARTWLSRLRTPALLSAGIAAAFLALLAYTRLFPEPPPLNETDVDALIQSAIASATPPPAFSSDVYRAILPSIVYIRSDDGDDETDDARIGTGVVISADGQILTAFHVVAGAERIVVFFADGTESEAVIAGAVPENDIAVLYPETLPGIVVPAVLGNPGALRIGDEAYAVGNPLGLVASMSAGVISGFDRSIPIEETGVTLTNLIQFDTAVNPGNSGGPLLDRYGRVIGIVTALANPAEQNFFVGIGFAVSIVTAGAAAGVPGY
jgi:S1-C subfamily serine protease